MDPYLELIIGDQQVYKTQVKDNAGTEPVWNEECTYEVKDLSLNVKFIVSDEEVFKDDIVGERTGKLDYFCSDDGNTFTKKYTISYEGETAGSVRIATTFINF